MSPSTDELDITAMAAARATIRATAATGCSLGTLLLFIWWTTFPDPIPDLFLAGAILLGFSWSLLALSRAMAAVLGTCLGIFTVYELVSYRVYEGLWIFFIAIALLALAFNAAKSTFTYRGGIVTSRADAQILASWKPGPGPGFFARKSQTWHVTLLLSCAVMTGGLGLWKLLPLLATPAGSDHLRPTSVWVQLSTRTGSHESPVSPASLRRNRVDPVALLALRSAWPQRSLGAPPSACSTPANSSIL